MPAPGRPSRSLRALVRLFPRSFRERFGDDVLRTLSAAHRAARARGVWAVVTFWLRNVLDLGAGAVRERIGVVGHRDAVSRNVSWLRESSGLAATIADMRLAARALRRRPALTATVVCTLALGIGANAAVFALIDALLLRPLPIARPDEVFAVYEVLNERSPYASTAFPTYVDLRESSTSFVSLAAFASQSAGLRVSERTDRVTVGVVTGNYFRTLGLRPQLGRLLVESDEAAPGSTPFAVLSDAFWRGFFGAVPDVVGREVQLSGTAFTVVGVAPRGFRGTNLTTEPVMWVPITMVQSLDPGGLFSANVLDTRAFQWVSMVGRLAPGRSPAVAGAELNALFDRLVETRPDEYGAEGVARAIRVEQVNLAATLSSRAPLLRFIAVPLVAAVLTLAIACLNVATLMLVRASERTRELGVRAALGASRHHLVRQLLVESLVLASVGAVLGLLVARVTTALLAGFTLPGDIAIASLDLSANPRFLMFAAGVALLTAIAFGLLPAWRAAKTDALAVLRTGGGGAGIAGRRIRSALVTTQVALSLLLLISAGLFVRSLREGLRTDTGFEASGVAAAAFGLRHYGYDEGAARTFWRALLERVSATQGIEAAALATHVPLGAQRFGMPLVPERRGEAEPSSVPTAVNSVIGDYFGALRIPVVEGRVFALEDDESSPLVAVVNQAAARSLWPGEASAIGQRLRLIRFNSDVYTVIGVVANAKAHSVGDEDLPYVYISSLQTPRLFAHEWTNVIARDATDGRHALATIEAKLAGLDAAVPVFDKRLVAEQVDAVLMPQRFGSTLLGVFGVVALLVSAVGVYGVVAYSVTRRAFELGVRRALGARTVAVVAAVVRESGIAVLAGIVVGLGAATYATRFVAAFLFGIEPLDAAAFTGATLLLAAAAALAALFPARRATRIDPMVVLRSADERSA